MDQQRVFGMTPWVRRLFVANLLVFVLQETVLGPRFLAAFGFAPMTAFAHPWTFVTYFFLHYNLLHLAFNLLGLFVFGPQVEERLGGKSFVLYYFACGIGGAVLVVGPAPGGRGGWVGGASGRGARPRTGRPRAPRAACRAGQRDGRSRPAPGGRRRPHAGGDGSRAREDLGARLGQPHPRRAQVSRRDEPQDARPGLIGCSCSSRSCSPEPTPSPLAPSPSSPRGSCRRRGVSPNSWWRAVLETPRPTCC